MTAVQEKKKMIKKGIGYSPITEKIYLGKQNEAKGLWVGEKEDITNDFINVMFQFVPESSTRTIRSLDTNSKNIFLNIKNDKENIKNAITFLNTQLKSLS